MDVGKRAVQLGFKYHGFIPRHMSQLVQSNAKPPSLPDTTALVRRLEAQGVPTKQAELAVAGAFIELSNNSIEKAAMEKDDRQQKIDMLQEIKFDSKFRSQLQSFPVHRLPMLLNGNEKKELRDEIENFCSDIRYQTDKVIAGHRLDVNLERGHIREELVSKIAETAKLTNKLENDIHALQAQLEAAKYDVIKYCLFTLSSIFACGLGIIHFWK